MTHRARKRFGQHFLHDPRIIARIVNAIDPQPGQRVVEIGPGRGALTIPLLDRLQSLDVVELDRDVIPLLRASCEGRGQLNIHNEDALRFDFSALDSDRHPLRVVGNLPYNISTPLLFRLLDQEADIQDMHFMLQKEVVTRMAADHGNKSYGRLTVMLAAACRVEALFDIGPGAFTPPPRVHSTFVRLVPWSTPPFPLEDRSAYAALVNMAFSRRRKTLKNALSDMLDEKSIIAADCDPRARPETVEPAGFARLAREYSRVS
jgi:16S rRNA (adenine1518-N6/adenine1519-N6)-dimethyltransferase